MTQYVIRYNLTDDQRSLLRDLLVYLICQYDKEISYGKTAPYIARRSIALDFLYAIKNEPLIGDDSVMGLMMDDVAILCNPIDSEIRKMLKTSSLFIEGIVGILSLYSNDTIIGLRKEIVKEPQ